MKFLEQRKAILSGNLYKVIITLSLPIMLNNLIQTVYNLTDTYFVSKIGGTQIAAITFVWPVIFFIMAMGIGIGIAGTAMISQCIGAKKFDEAKEIAGQVISFSVLFSILLGVFGYFIAPSIVKIMGAKGELLSEGVIYLKIIFLSAPLMFMAFGYSSVKQAEGDTLSPMIIALISVGINIILDPIFIFTFHLGIKGAGIATLLARLLASIVIIYKLFINNKGIKIDFRNLILEKNIIIELIKIGLPSSMGQSLTAFGFVILNMFVVKFGDNTLAALGIGNRINSLLFMPSMGIGSAITSIAGQNIGADNYERVKESVIKSGILSTVFSVTGMILLLSTKIHIAKAFTTDTDILTKSIQYLNYVAVAVPFMGLFQIFMGVFQGAGHTILTMNITLSRLWLIRIPGILILQKFFNMNEYAIWYSVFFSNILICIVALMFYLHGGWKKQVIKKVRSSSY